MLLPILLFSTHTGAAVRSISNARETLAGSNSLALKGSGSHVDALPASEMGAGHALSAGKVGTVPAGSRPDPTPSGGVACHTLHRRY